MTDGHDFQPQEPLIVQGDHTVLVEVDNPRYAEARDVLARFCGAGEVAGARAHLPAHAAVDLERVRRGRECGEHRCRVARALEVRRAQPRRGQCPGLCDAVWRPPVASRGAPTGAARAGPAPAEGLAHQPTLTSLLRERRTPLEFVVAPADRGRLKQALIKLGFPTEDLAGYQPGESLDLSLRSVTPAGRTFAPRDYPREAAELFHAGGAERGGSGVVVLPCGAGSD